MSVENDDKTPNKAEEQVNARPAMSPQQQRFTAGTQGRLETYKEMIVGEKGWGAFAAFELYNLLLSNTPSIAGVGLRGIILPLFQAGSAAGLYIGRNVVIRQPHRIEFGRRVIVDDYAGIDVRTSGAESNARISIGDHVVIGRYSLLVAKDGEIKLGRACNISSYCRIATQSRIEIGESVLIAAYAYIGPGNHRFAEDGEASLIEQEMDIKGGVTIGDHAWIGARATILDGVRIGKHAVVGAHSLVREDVPDGAVVAGSPARILKYRDERQA